ncbi:MAG TPA: ABC transporter substrate-binding protein [Candidatus Limnocylindrales bacterium]|jgi:polar amino acid transport system substrate-binding protein
MGRIRFATFGVIALLVAACSGGEGASTAPSQAASTTTAATPAPTEDACAAANLDTVSPGLLTIATSEPAFPPYFAIDDPIPDGSIWTLGQPPNGMGLESATAYGVAQKLGFSNDQVNWVIGDFNTVTQPGDKDFDLFIAQVSYSAERAGVVDLSDGYFDNNQAVVAVKGSDITKVTTVAGLKPFKFGAQVGTTSLAYITDQIKPTKEPSVYDSNDAAVQALNAGQIDAIVADLPTTFYMRDAQLDNGQIVGSLPSVPGVEVEHFSILLDKGSALTPCVNAALAAMKEDGTLDGIVEAWITSQGAPELK